MSPLRWPDDLNDILAKSASTGGETLAQHTWDVLEKLAALHNLRPTLPMLTGEPHLWHCLFWTCLLHDFGKAARGFQLMLKGGDKWKQRHEVLSLVFFDWIASGLSQNEQRWIVAAIVSHHRDAAKIQELYPDTDPDPLVPLLAELDSDVVSRLWSWINTCAIDWITALGFTSEEVQPLPLLPHDQAVAQVLQHGLERVRYWLDYYQEWVDYLGYPLPTQEIVLPVLLRGLTTTADHMASAHLTEMPGPVREEWLSLAMRIRKKASKVEAEEDAYEHQCQSAAQSGTSTLLIAPTGSGKTEAALYWTLGNGSRPVPRLFYALPYQASMNALFDRLKDEANGFGEQAVGLQHGRAVQALYARLVDQEARPATAAERAKWEKNINQLHARPVTVFSPYQMLKAAFQLRGFEAILTDYTQASFIFDEIHAYEPSRLALILALVKYLQQNYDARFFVMSATFPGIIEDKLAWALGSHATISADPKVFEKFRRHRLQLLDGGLLENGIGQIVRDVQDGKNVLACVNTVRRAQGVRDALLAAGMPREQIMLIHSRYIVKHRAEREKEIRQRCEIGVERADQQGFVLIATQVVEVSLNIDLDTIYTDPAPLEALLQRFGRVNRACKKGICTVHVFRQPDDGQYVYGRHKDEQQRGRIVRVTLAELEQHDGEEIDESQINTWLNHIYDDPMLKQQWEEEYQRVALSAESILANLRPFNSNRQKEDDFGKLFDNVDVLPQDYEQTYLDHTSKGEFIEASQYFVGISKQKYSMLADKGLVRPADDPNVMWNKWVVRLPYADDSGLSFEPTATDPDWD